MASRILVLTLISSMLLLSCGVRRPAVVSGTPNPDTQKIQPLSQPRSLIKSFEDDRIQEFKKIFKRMSADLPYADLVYNVYERKAFQPILIRRFIQDDQLQALLDCLDKTNEHGLDSEPFSVVQLKRTLGKLTRTAADTARENYHKLVVAELATATSLVTYSMALQYGLVDPSNIYSNYSTPTARPDSISIAKIFEIKDLKKYLDSIQPKDKIYLALQKVLSTLPFSKKTDSLRTLLLNLERLRWKNRPMQDKFVLVNIPGFTLDIFNSGKPVLNMKVCVGEPGVWQTPQLGSMIHSIQVNPVWNIPQSIARDEIAREAAGDRYYLANSNIKVYHKGKLVGRTEAIDWSLADLSEYTFQQQPGLENALGRIKFLFQNESSVYLHDTPVKAAFHKKMRAVSHGCVRVEKPLELAYVLFGKGEQFDLIKKAMQRGYPRAKFIALPVHIPVRLGYYTAWTDNSGKVQFFKDIYGLDQALYEAMRNVK